MDSNWYIRDLKNRLCLQCLEHIQTFSIFYLLSNLWKYALVHCTSSSCSVWETFMSSTVSSSESFLRWSPSLMSIWTGPLDWNLFLLVFCMHGRCAFIYNALLSFKKYHQILRITPYGIIWSGVTFPTRLSAF